MDPIRKIVKQKSVDDVSYIPFLAIFVNCSIWISYGYLLGDHIIFISNSIGSLFGFAYTWIYFYHAKNREIRDKILKLFGFALLIIMTITFVLPYWLIKCNFDASIVIGIIGDITSVSMRASPLISINQVIKYKTTRGLSLFMSCSMTLHGFAWCLYGFIIMDGDVYIIIPNALGFMAGLLQLLLFCCYHRGVEYEMLLTKSLNASLDKTTLQLEDGIVEGSIAESAVTVSTEV